MKKVLITGANGFVGKNCSCIWPSARMCRF
jgi:hypothetical protein